MSVETDYRINPGRFPFLDAHRAAALSRWRTANDQCGIDEEALGRAAALAPVIMDDDRPAFGNAFREFAEFIAAMLF